MKKRFLSRLTLHRETLRNLDPNALRAVEGAAPTFLSCQTCIAATCNTCHPTACPNC